MMTRLITLFCSLFLVSAYALDNQKDSERYHNLIQEIRCVVCQNQNIADSNAPLANDLREKIQRLIENHESDQAIKDYLVKRYGEFILLKPAFNPHTGLLWIAPFLMLIGALVYVVIYRLKALRPKKGNN